METDKAHILVVDDDTRLRSLLQRFLRENDFYGSVAKDAAEARERLSEYKFDLLIVDIMMPNESGLDFFGDVAAGKYGSGDFADGNGRNGRPDCRVGDRCG